MAQSIEISAKTIDAAIEKGLSELSLQREDVTVEVLENPKSGFLGIGATPAKILMTVLGSEGATPAKKAEKKAEKAEKKIEKKEEKQVEKEVKKETVPATGDAAEFLSKVLSFICEDVRLEQHKASEEGTVSFEIVGENLGGIIGRRGETLDALQHLANLAVNRSGKEKVRVLLDAENYREKREESLAKFADRAASQVLKYKRSKALEPMNAYERHIIHASLQNRENISTSSVGTDPNRRVIINYTGPDARPSRPPRRRYNNYNK